MPSTGTNSRSGAVTILIAFIAIAASTSSAAPKDRPTAAFLERNPSNQQRIAETYSNLPLCFEANLGQTDARVAFLSRGPGYTLFLTGDEAVFALGGSKTRDNRLHIPGRLQPKGFEPTEPNVLRMKLINARAWAKAVGVEQITGKSNYLIGNDPKNWRINIPNFAKVRYQNVYSGVDLVYHGNQRQLEYDFVVAPLTNPRQIQWEVIGATSTRQENGDLVFVTDSGEVRWHKPIAYQEENRTRHPVPAQFVVEGDGRIGLQPGAYNHSRPLTVDPVVGFIGYSGYSTFLGGGRSK